MERLCSGLVDIFVVIDVVVWGFDVECIGLVINYDMLFDSEVYVYCIGWMGWVGCIGEVVLFVILWECCFICNFEWVMG